MQWTDLQTVRAELVGLIEQRGGRPVVAFDADSTLWMSDVANRLWDYLIEHRLLRAEAGPHIASVLGAEGGEPSGDPHRDATELFERYAAGRAHERAVVELQATGLVGFPESDLRAAVRASFEHGKRRLADACFAGMRELIDALRGRGARVVVCSGSPQVAVEEAALFYEITPADVCSFRTRIDRGRMTTEVESYTAGDGKVTALGRLCAEPPLAAFGDSLSDVPLLQSATSLACMINPRPGLRAATPTIPAPVRWVRIPTTVGGHAAPIPDQDESTLV